MKMMTLKIAVLAIMIASSSLSLSLNHGDINNIVVRPNSPATFNYALSTQMLSRDFAPIRKDAVVIDIIKPVAAKATPVLKVAHDKYVAPVKLEINKDKTYEQCMKEAFDRLYEEVNKKLNDVVDSPGSSSSCA